MVHLPKQKVLALPRPLEFCDVAGDFRGADDLAFCIFDRRNGEGDINEAPVLALSNRLVVLNPFTATDTVENHRFFVRPVSWKKYRHRPADGLLGRVAKEPSCAVVPTGDDA